MCGRFTITLEPADIQDELDLGEVPANFVARYNVAPSQAVAVVRDYATRNIEWMRWGLIPSWAKIRPLVIT
jgi:putative SOS response-associated peptidase YedK